MNDVKFFVVINTRMSEEEGQKLWARIKHGKEVNLTLLTDQVLIYGNTTRYVFADILCQLKKYDIQLYIE